MTSISSFNPSDVSSGHAQMRRNRWWAVAVPWGVLALVTAATYVAFSSLDEHEADDVKSRFLWEEESSLPIDELQDDQPVLPFQNGAYQVGHKALFPLDSADWWGFGAATVGLMLAAGGGIGGGGMLVPIYCLVMHMTPKHAIPLSNVSVLGGALANLIFNVKKRHPHADRPLIDWDLILAMEPQTMGGALMGAILNKVLPEIVLTLLLAALLSFTAYGTLKTAQRLYNAETKAMKFAAQRVETAAPTELTKLTDRKFEQDEEEAPQPPHAQVNDGGDVTKRNPCLQKILERERHIPLENFVIMMVLFVVVLGGNILKGGGAVSPLDIACGSAAFWMANIGIFAWIFAASCYARSVLLRKHRERMECGYQYLESDIQWCESNTLKYPAICALAGYFAGMFGVGGGIVKGPLMLAMNVHPAVGAATSATMILFTSLTATTYFVVFGLLQADYGLACFLLGFFATCVGQEGLNRMMKKAGRNSYIAFSIGIVVLLSAVMMTVQSLLSILAGERHHTGGICGAGD